MKTGGVRRKSTVVGSHQPVKSQEAATRRHEQIRRRCNRQGHPSLSVAAAEEAARTGRQRAEATTKGGGIRRLIRFWPARGSAC